MLEHKIIRIVLFFGNQMCRAC